MEIEQAPQDLTGYLQDYVPHALQAFNVPGASVAIIKDGQVVLERSYGYRDFESQVPVDNKTVFAIGSTTKAFTAVLLGTLVDEGKLNWNDLVIDHLPGFRLADPVATMQMTIKDLLCHRSGLPRHDLVWFFSSLNTEELFGRLRFLDPFAPFRLEFCYNNLLYMVAGMVIERIAGTRFETAVVERIFRPLGMKDANCSVTESLKSANYALPYDASTGRIERIPFHNIDSVAPAGAINAHIGDYARWLQMNLGGGRFDGARIISEENLDEILAPQMIIPRTNVLVASLAKHEEIGPMSYTLGWVRNAYRGRPCLQHEGGIDGFRSFLAFFPADQIGIAILTNVNGAAMHYGLTYDIADRLLGFSPRPWLARIRESEEAEKLTISQSMEQLSALRVQATCPSHTLEEYGGVYEHPAYGRIGLRIQDDALVGEYNGIPITLKHLHYDVFLTRFEIKGPEIEIPMTFFSGIAGTVDKIFMQLEALTKEIEFARVTADIQE